jgi:hypothetical protein
VSGRMGSRVAWSVCGLTLALIACTIALFVLNRFGIRELPYFLVAEATAALVGSLIASRRPRNPVGWIVSGHAFCFSLGEFSRQYAIYGLQTDPDSLPFALAMASPSYWIWLPGIILMFAFLPLYFPDGRLLSPRWRVVFWITVLVGLFETVLALVRPGDNETPGIPNPLGVEGLNDLALFRDFFDAAGSAPWLAVGILSATSLVVRFGRSRGEERQQIKWVVYAVVLLIAYTLLDQILLENRVAFVADVILFIVFFEGLWVAIGVAILRYRLYDVDVIINRTLVYASLTAMLVLVYLGGIVLLQTLFRALTGQESQLAIVASTLVIAALFGPLRRRVQAFIDRRFYRGKYDAAKTLEAFSARLRDGTDLGTLDEELVGVVRETMQPTHASLWLRLPVEIGGVEREQAGWGSGIKGGYDPRKRGPADIQSGRRLDFGG